MFHRVQRRCCACGHADLAVGVLDVPVGGADRDSERTCDLLGLQPPREQPDGFITALSPEQAWELLGLTTRQVCCSFASRSPGEGE